LSRPALSAAASVLAGAGLLFGAPHAFGSVELAPSITPGAFEIEATGIETAALGHPAGEELVVVPGETVTITATARITVVGDDDELSATLKLDTTDLFAVAPAPIREELEAGTRVHLDGLVLAAGTDDTWVVPAQDEPYEVEAVISVTVPDLPDMQGQPLSTGTLSWSLTQNV
jgi:alternate signal-mediated exported protein